MVGCDGAFTRNNFRTACSLGWHVATASDYYSFGGKTVVPTERRFVDVTWDSSGKEISLDYWEGYHDSSNGGGWDSLAKNDYCIWLSYNARCNLSFSNKDYGQIYGCHCQRESNAHGVVCVQD